MMRILHDDWSVRSGENRSDQALGMTMLLEQEFAVNHNALLYHSSTWVAIVHIYYIKYRIF